MLRSSVLGHAAAGRDPDTIKVLFLAYPLVDTTDGGRHARFMALFAMSNVRAWPSLRFAAMQWFVCYCCTPMAIEAALIAVQRPTPNHRVGNETFRTTQNRQSESE
jgi:hypothetical protein